MSTLTFQMNVSYLNGEYLYHKSAQLAGRQQWAARNTKIDFEKRNLQRIRAALNCLTGRERKVRDIISQIVYISMFIL